MQIHIGRNNQQLGTFSTEQVLSGLASGQFLPTDIAWHDGLGDWEPLSSLAALSAPPPSPVVAAAPAAAPPKAFELPRIERPETPPSRIKGLILRAVVIVVLFLIAIPTAGFVQDKWLQSRSSANARTIITACKQYAGQHNGSYPPDLATLIKEKIIADEKPLHCPMLEDDTQTGYEIISKYPAYKNLECVLTEIDPDGWAAGGAWDNINLNFRNTEYYPSFVAAAFDKYRVEPRKGLR